MMHHEFEAFYGQEETAEEYKKIEYCYMHLDNPTLEKKDIVNLYKLLGEDMFHRLYMDIGAFGQHVHSEVKETSRLADKLRYCEHYLEQLKEYVNNIDFVLTNNIKYVNNNIKELLGNLNKFEN